MFQLRLIKYGVIFCALCSLLMGKSQAAQVTAPSPHPLPQPEESPLPDHTLRRIRVPILMYHYVSPLPPDADEIRMGLTVTPETFQQHLFYLQAEGFSTISLYALDHALLTGAPLPWKPIVLTFDDGHIDHYTNVFPMLREYGFTGTFFIITGKADWAAPDYLSWGQIQEMASAGMSMEAHTKTHQDLRQREYDFLVYEVLGSIESLEAHIGARPQMFAYPAGRYDETVLRVIESAGIQRAVTTVHGLLHTTDNRLLMRRVRVNGDLSVAGLAALLASSE